MRTEAMRKKKGDAKFRVPQVAARRAIKQSEARTENCTAPKIVSTYATVMPTYATRPKKIMRQRG